MAQYIEIGRVFTPDKGGECDIRHDVEYDHSQCSDSAKEAEDLTRTENNTYESETNNLEDLLDMNGNIGCFVYRVDLPQSGWQRSRLSHCIHHAGSSVCTGNTYRQCAVDNGKEVEYPA